MEVEGGTFQVGKATYGACWLGGERGEIQYPTVERTFESISSHMAGVRERVGNEAWGRGAVSLFSQDPSN